MTSVSPAAQVPVRVLIVDDELVIADTLVLILKSRGFDARAAYSGEEAVQIAATWSPDAVISDVIMGPMDGIALAIYLSHSLPACKVLLISGHPSTADLIGKLPDRGQNFPILAKPFSPETVLQFLGSMNDPATPAS